MSRLPGPTMDEVPGDRPATGITRPSLVDNSWSEVGKPKDMANAGMDVDFPTEGRRRGLNGSNLR